MVTEYSLAGKTAVVTAAGRGIAKGVALVLAEAGADVALVALTPTHIEAVAAQVRAAGRRALTVPTDVTDPEAVELMAAAVLAEFGSVDILVNGAGDSISKPVATLPASSNAAARPGMSPEEWRSILDINLTEAFLCCRAFGAHFIERKAGKVINIGSFASIRPRAMGTAYAAGKAGVANFTAALALEWAPYGIQVNCIAPGQFPDPDQMTAEQYAAGLERARTAVPAGRPGYLRDVGLLALYLASPASDFMTGQTLHLDGGATL